MPHTHQYDTRYKDSRVGEMQRDTETYEAQPVPEMEVITINNIETSTDEIPQVELEMEVRVSDQPDKPSEEARWDHMMRMMMEQFGQIKEDSRSLREDGRKSRAENKKSIELLNKNMESINKNMEALKEDLNKKIDSTHKSMHTLNSKIDDSSRAIREELNTAVKKISQKMDEMSKKYTKEVDQTTREELPNDNNSEVEGVPNDETMEELSQQPEDTDRQTENEEDSKALVPEDTHHRNEENIQHKEAIIKSIENTQIIKKTGEKETKVKGIIRSKKTRITKEILEMTRSGLINFVDNPIIRRKARINGKKYKPVSYTHLDVYKRQV